MSAFNHSTWDQTPSSAAEMQWEGTRDLALVLYLGLESHLIPLGEEFEHNLKAWGVFEGHLSCVSISAYSDGCIWGLEGSRCLQNPKCTSASPRFLKKKSQWRTVKSAFYRQNFWPEGVFWVTVSTLLKEAFRQRDPWKFLSEKQNGRCWTELHWKV